MAQTRLRVAQLWDDFEETLTWVDSSNLELKRAEISGKEIQEKWKDRHRSWFVKPILEEIVEQEIPEITKEEFKVLNLDNTELGVVNSEEEGIELFLSHHPVFDREAVKTFIYPWKIFY